MITSCIVESIKWFFFLYFRLLSAFSSFQTALVKAESPLVSQIVNCSYVYHDVFYNKRACIFENLFLRENEPFLIDTTYEGTFIHEGLFNTVRFIDSHVPYIPQEFLKKFFNTERFYMNATEVETIAEDSFRYAANLRELFLDHNKIEILASNCFTLAKQVSLIDLSHNSLVIFNSKAFEHLTQLRRLYLSYNRIISFETDAFKSIPSLSVIKLDNNLLATIDPGLFYNNLFIENIDISHNGLMTLELHFIGGRLRHLDATSNNLQKISLKSDVKTYDVSVNLSNNKLIQFYLPINIEIVRLNVENNRLGKSLIEISNITAVTTLRELYLGHNMLPPLEPETFTNLSNLKYLGLPNTDLHELRSDVMQSLRGLTVLDISYNPLRTIDLNALEPLQNLRSLYINGDELNGMDIKNVKDYLPNIFELEVSDTEWNCLHLQETINEMRNKSVYIVANKQKYVHRKKNINGIYCYGILNGTYGYNGYDDDFDKANEGVSKNPVDTFSINWFILGGTLIVVILTVLLITKTVRYIMSSKRERRNDFNHHSRRNMFTDVAYSSD